MPRGWWLPLTLQLLCTCYQINIQKYNKNVKERSWINALAKKYCQGSSYLWQLRSPVTLALGFTLCFSYSWQSFRFSTGHDYNFVPTLQKFQSKWFREKNTIMSCTPSLDFEGSLCQYKGDTPENNQCTLAEPIDAYRPCANVIITTTKTTGSRQLCDQRLKNTFSINLAKILWQLVAESNQLYRNAKVV